MNKKYFSLTQAILEKVGKTKHGYNIFSYILGFIFFVIFFHFLWVCILSPIVLSTLGKIEIARPRNYLVGNTQIYIIEKSNINTFLYENFVLKEIDEYIYDKVDEIYFYPGKPREYAFINGWIKEEEIIGGGSGLSISWGKNEKKVIVMNSDFYDKSDLYHEFGHIVDYNWGDVSESEEFQKIAVEEAEALWPTPIVDDYAKSSFAEAFAEAYAVYYTNPSRMKRVAPQLYNYFDNIVQTERTAYAQKMQKQEAL